MSTLISSPSMGIGWLKCLSWIIEHGNQVYDGNVELKEYVSFLLDIADASQSDMFVESLWEQPYSNHQQIKIKQFDYRSRLLNYDGINQLDSIRHRLLNKPEAKSATAVTMMPGSDVEQVPCLISIDFKIRDSRLITQAFFRSQDVWNKQPLNLLFLKEMASLLADGLKVQIGAVKLYIASAHIYQKDFRDVIKFIKENHEHAK